jgi:enoyl-CoA hydratase/carnithine racemase
MHSDLPRLLDDIAFDRDDRVLVITGTGDRFMTEIDGASLGDLTKPMASDISYLEGRRIPQRLADLEMPIISAVNGPASVHSEYVLIADIVVASETAEFSDFPHITFGLSPGDGLQIVWEEALGINRAATTRSPKARSRPPRRRTGEPSPRFFQRTKSSPEHKSWVRVWPKGHSF